MPDDRETMHQLYHTAQPDLVLVHENYPDFDVLLNLRTIQSGDKYIPIMLIVSNPAIANAVSAFHLCVSDCVMIDIQPPVLVQRIQRCLTTLAPEKPKIPLGSQALYLPNDFQILCRNEERIELLPKENRLLLLLCDRQGGIVPKEELIQALWGQKNLAEQFPLSHWQMNLDSLMYCLKKKLKDLDDICIENMKKIGYRLCLPADV